MPTVELAAAQRQLAAQRGLSLVEMMVGIAVGLFVVAAAAMLVSTQLNENRRMLLETQVQQDLRAASDIITRELRRAGHWHDAAYSVFAVGMPLGADPYSALAPQANGVSASQVDFTYWRRQGEEGPYGLKLENGVLKTRLGFGGWQELTDANTLRITAFSVTPRNVDPPMRLPCPKLCPDGTDSCWPTLTVRELAVDITGRAVSDPSVQRSLRTTVRLRNDLVQVTLGGAPLQACPL